MNRKLHATVRKSTEQTKHSIGILGPDGPNATSEMPVAVKLEISADDNGVFLIRFDKNGTFCGDTWHQSIDDAKEQASFEFSVADSDWDTTPSV